MANILITGANGQLGTELRNRSFSLLDDVFYTDIEELDITNFKAICSFIETHDIDTIINCAAYTAVDQAEEDEEKAMKLNRDAVANLANAAVKLDCLLLHISTDYVFDGTSDHPYTEKDPTNPQSVYGRTKLEGEQAIKKSGCLYLIIRTAWLYSEYGNNFMKTVLRLGKERDELRFIFDQVGTPTYAGDLAVAMLAVLERAEAGKFIPGIYHFSDEGVCSWYDFTVKILQIAGMNNRVIPIETKDYPTPASRPHYSVLNKGKIKSTYGLTIPHWETSLAYCMNNKV
mgnify:FL=1